MNLCFGLLTAGYAGLICICMIFISVLCILICALCIYASLVMRVTVLPIRLVFRHRAKCYLEYHDVTYFTIHL